MNSKVNLCFPADPQYLQPLQQLGERLLALWVPASATTPEAFEILLAIQELVTNVIRHGYKGKGGEIQVEFRLDGNEFRVEVRDWGAPFNPEKVPLPDFEKPVPGGYGVFIIKKVTDHHEYRREGETNIAQLMKRFPQPEPSTERSPQ